VSTVAADRFALAEPLTRWHGRALTEAVLEVAPPTVTLEAIEPSHYRPAARASAS